MTSVLLPIVVILTLVLVNGLFVAAEFALVGARPTRLHALAEGGSRGARWLAELVDRPTGKDSYIAVAQLGITIASIGLGMYGEPAVATWLYGPFEDLGLSHSASHVAGFIIALSAITFMHVVFGEMIPKALALQAPEAVSVKVNPLMRTFALIFRPMVAVLNATAFALMRLLRIPEPDKTASLYTSSELAIVTDEAAESGSLGEMQRNLIHNVFELDERTAEELMTPRNRIESLELATTAEELLGLIASSERSRYPVTDGDLDHVVGMLHIKDVIRAQQRGRALVLAELVRPLPSVVAATSAEDLLEEFRRSHTHACLVLDEFGGTLGLVTLDDVIAEVMDDEVADRGEILRHPDGSFDVIGEVTLAELRDEGVELHHDDVSTVAGLVLAICGTVPEVGATVEADGWALTVTEVDGRRIAKLRVVAQA